MAVHSLPASNVEACSESPVELRVAGLSKQALASALILE